MALTRVQTAITWSSASSIALNDTATHGSDAYTFDATDIQAAIQVYASNGGTPASGDTVNCRMLYTCGDVLGDSGDDYDTARSGELIAVLDTYGTDSWGENPALRTMQIPVGAKGFKLQLDAPQGNSRTITCRAMISVQRSA